MIQKLIGKKIEDDNMKINITKRFYKGESLPEEKIIALINQAMLT